MVIAPDGQAGVITQGQNPQPIYVSTGGGCAGRFGADGAVVAAIWTGRFGQLETTLDSGLHAEGFSGRSVQPTQTAFGK